jgi:hypothetical protein
MKALLALLLSTYFSIKQYVSIDSAMAQDSLGKIVNMIEFNFLKHG